MSSDTIDLQAGRDVAITATEERHSRYDYSKVKESDVKDAEIAPE